MEPSSLQKLLDDINAQIAAGRMIDAIKLYREATGAGLAEAKEAVELIAAGRPPRSGAAPTLATDALQEVSALVKAGRKLEAIKRYRQEAGVDLKGAKDAVDALELEFNPDAVVARAVATRRTLRFLALAVLIVVAVVALLLLTNR